MNCDTDTQYYFPGQLGLDAKSMEFVDGGVQAQAKRALENMG